MSGQTSIIIIVGIVAASIVLWMLNTYNQFSLKTRTVSSSEIDKINSYVDIIKSFSRNALQLSVHKALSFDASRSRTFYCNQPSPPNFRILLHDIEILTNTTFNEYLQQVKFDDPNLNLEISKSTCISFDINENDLMSGKYNEEFNVSEYGSQIKIKYGDNFIQESNEIKDETIVRNRFWLIYSGFKRWAETTRAFENICGCLQDSSICGCQNIQCNSNCENCRPLYLCTRESILNGVKELDQIFNDEFIECEGRLENCVLNIEDSSCKDEISCGGWVNEDCFSCEFDNEEDLCAGNLLHGLARAQTVTTTITQWNCLVSKKTIKYKAKITFTCVDKKYALPLEASPEAQNLIYKVTAYFANEIRGVCPGYITTTNPPPNNCGCAAAPPGPPGPPEIPPGSPEPPPPKG
ncbi:MAG: hypothetical protein NZ893_02180 [Candidatus Aenigmarchaeota archaeon]|nr:hypothetical protein [Candidatus Aenigmarchaeota archaeon]